jgi:hypothetical protein
MDLWRPRLGVVVMVDKDAGFALIDIGTAPAPAAGTPLKTFTLEKEGSPKIVEAPPATAELTVSAFQKRPFLIADLKSGLPKMGDSVVTVEPAGSAGNGSGAVSGSNRPAERPKDSKKPDASNSTSAPAGKASSLNRPAGEAAPSAGEASPAVESGSIIPGIAPRPAGAGAPQ